MLKKLITLSSILVVFLAACQSASTSPTALTETQVESSQDEPSTPPPPLPQVSPTPSAEGTVLVGEANCTVVSRQPTPGPTAQSIFPPVSDSDWVQGLEDAKVTIIEYGDFQ